VRALEGSASARESDGLAMLAIMVALCGLAAGAVWIAARAESSGRLSPLAIALPRSMRIAIAVSVLAAGAAVVAVAAQDRGHSALGGASAQRLQSLESNRYEYWKVALENGFAPDPLKGTGAGGFAVIWLEHRDVDERAKVAHSLYIETLAELGAVGFLCLAVFLAGVVLAARRAWQVDAARAAGPAAALVVALAHSALDWDWEMPALTLVMLALAGLLVAISESGEAQPA
jgi:O-antigen ligase